jgi:hypothetical protein
LDINSAVYEWNYQKQLLGIKLQEGSHFSIEEKEKHIFGTDYLLQRPLLQSISEKENSPVLLIDELDRSDEEFEFGHPQGCSTARAMDRLSPMGRSLAAAGSSEADAGRGAPPAGRIFVPTRVCKRSTIRACESGSSPTG